MCADRVGCVHNAGDVALRLANFYVELSEEREKIAKNLIVEFKPKVKEVFNNSEPTLNTTSLNSNKKYADFLMDFTSSLASVNINPNILRNLLLYPTTDPFSRYILRDMLIVAGVDKADPSIKLAEIIEKFRDKKLTTLSDLIIDIGSLVKDPVLWKATVENMLKYTYTNDQGSRVSVVGSSSELLVSALIDSRKGFNDQQNSEVDNFLDDLIKYETLTQAQIEKVVALKNRTKTVVDKNEVQLEFDFDDI